MTNSLLLMIWPTQNGIYHSFRFATGYDLPPVYTGNATLTTISSNITDTDYTLIFRCQDCLKTDSANSAGALFVLGWAQAYAQPGNPTCPNSITFVQHDNGMNIFGAELDSRSNNPSYASAAALATTKLAPVCGGSNSTPTTTSVTTTRLVTTSATTASGSQSTAATYDYIIAGAGAAGIPLADRLSEAGKTVLLIEKGFASSGRWGGTIKPTWLQGTNLTRFDVPGLCNQIWVDSKDIACDDTDQMAGCVLGGGTAVNSGIWWRVSVN